MAASHESSYGPTCGMKDKNVLIKDRYGKKIGNLCIPLSETEKGEGIQISVSKLFGLLVDSGYKDTFIYFVHCRTTPNSSIIPFSTYPLVHPTKNDRQNLYLIVQSHGQARPYHPLSLDEKDLDYAIFRANLGYQCMQHGDQAGEYQVYDEAMSFFASGARQKMDKTDDLLSIRTMKIVLSNYSLRGDRRFVTRGSFQEGQVNTGPPLKRSKTNPRRSLSGRRPSISKTMSISEMRNLRKTIRKSGKRETSKKRR